MPTPPSVQWPWKPQNEQLFGPPQPSALPTNFLEQAGSTTDSAVWRGLKSQLQRQPRNDQFTQFTNALYANPLSRTFDNATSAGRGGLGTRLGNAFGYDQRKALAMFGALMAGGAAGAGAFGGAGAAGSAGAGTAGGWAGSASTIDPFLADAGLGTAWGSVGAGAGAGLSTGLGAESAASGGAGAGGGFFDPSGTFHAGAAAGDFGAMAGGSAAAGVAPWYNSPLGQTAIRSGGGLLLNQIFGGQTGAERDQRNLANASYEDLQRFLPPGLRSEFSGPAIESGLKKLAELLQNPGGLSPTVNEAILPRLAAESQSIAQNYRNLQSNQAGAAARGNAPISIKNALQSALDVAQERAQRGARNEALVQSETMRREDIQQIYPLLQTILQFLASGRGQATVGLNAAAQSSAQRQAATLALIASLLQSHGANAQRA